VPDNGDSFGTVGITDVAECSLAVDELADDEVEELSAEPVG
jgi:hypothetical protein